MAAVSDAAFLELLASYEQALELAGRANAIVRALTEAHVAGQRLPDSVVEQYVEQADRAEQGIERLRALITTYR
ncbi:MAG: hypothetical protein LC791_16175 [Acidobacteria bacterium]|nr:hypothetical protein [Acidobacteriota bacterium]